MLSIRESRKSLEISVGTRFPNLKIDSTTESSADVVSRPVNAIQSFVARPAPINSEPLLTVPATTGTCNSEAISFWVSTGVLAATRQPCEERAA